MVSSVISLVAYVVRGFSISCARVGRAEALGSGGGGVIRPRTFVAIHLSFSLPLSDRRPFFLFILGGTGSDFG